MNGEVRFSSFLMGGFEGSTHRRSDGRRLDLVASTRHDRFARKDYRRLKDLGVRTVRESLRWHLIEPAPGQCDFGFEAGRVIAAQEEGMQVIWDLAHFGWPDHVDVFSAEFPDAFARYARAAGDFLAMRADGPLLIAPMNEISFLSWAGGEHGLMNPHVVGRGAELKRQLVRASILAIDAVRGRHPDTRFVQPEPLVNIVTDPRRPHERSAAEEARNAQFETWDMLAGRTAPELGGSSHHLDIVGVNYYPDNQWILGGGSLPADSPLRTELSDMLHEVYARYRRPLVITETGTEDGARPAWLRHVWTEVRRAATRGVPVGGICLYPILNHPGWEDDRHCCNGVWDYPGPAGGRQAYGPMRRLILHLQESLSLDGGLLAPYRSVHEISDGGNA
ncbi:MAG TPA: beta-glucosidase [Candidatus Limnocylindria bacterium]|nr:beta-glucosidase [Candidatus Limnocylindria bacterium]